jgi:hypothetical protein
LWPLGLEALQRRASPQAARVAGVLPEIVEVPSAPRDERDVVGAVVDGGQRIAIGSEAGGAEARQRGGVLSLDPCQRLRAPHVLEPEIGIVIGSGDRGPGVDGHDNDLLAIGRIASLSMPSG